MKIAGDFTNNEPGWYAVTQVFAKREDITGEKTRITLKLKDIVPGMYILNLTSYHLVKNIKIDVE